MARRVFLHVGPPKTGTSYLQRSWWHQRSLLAENGLLIPGRRRIEQFRACSAILQMEKVSSRLDSDPRDVLDAVVTEIGSYPGDALLSGEHLASARVGQVREACARLADVADEVHVVVTARDFTRQVPAAWQQSVKQGNDKRFSDYWRSLAADDSRGFWKFQDLPSVLDRWGARVPAERTHLVTHAPAATASSTMLWDRVCEVTGVSPTLDAPLPRRNESLGAVEIELLRRVHAQLPPDRDRVAFGRFSKGPFVRTVLAASKGGAGPRFAPDAAAREWMVERGSQMVDELRQRRFQLVGSLDDLLPNPSPVDGRQDDEVTEAEVAAAASTVLAGVIVQQMPVGQRPRAGRARKRATGARRRAQPSVR